MSPTSPSFFSHCFIQTSSHPPNSSPPFPSPLHRTSGSGHAPLGPWGTPYQVSVSLAIASLMTKASPTKKWLLSTDGLAFCRCLKPPPGLPCHGTNSGHNLPRTGGLPGCVSGQYQSIPISPRPGSAAIAPSHPSFRPCAWASAHLANHKKVRCSPTLTALSQHTHQVLPARDMRDMRHTLFV